MAARHRYRAFSKIGTRCDSPTKPGRGRFTAKSVGSRHALFFLLEIVSTRLLRFFNSPTPWSGIEFSMGRSLTREPFSQRCLQSMDAWILSAERDMQCLCDVSFFLLLLQYHSGRFGSDSSVFLVFKYFLSLRGIRQNCCQ